jgi:hypothetical protein
MAHNTRMKSQWDKLKADNAMLVEACREALPCCINGSEQSLGHAIKILEQALNATQR